MKSQNLTIWNNETNQTKENSCNLNELSPSGKEKRLTKQDKADNNAIRQEIPWKITHLETSREIFSNNKQNISWSFHDQSLLFRLLQLKHNKYFFTKSCCMASEDA